MSFNLNDFSKYRNQLMGIAILSIMVFHFGENSHNAIVFGTVPVDYYSTIVRWFGKLCYFMGSIGVEAFLFLSGIGLYYSFSKNSDIKSFYKKRVTRLLIPYFLFAPFYLFVQDLFFTKNDIAYYICDIFSLQFWMTGQKIYWYIDLILLLYFVFPFIYKYFNVPNKQKGIRFIIFFVLYTAVLFGLNHFYPTRMGYWEIALTRVPVFVLGCAMGELVKKGMKFNWIFGVIAMLALLSIKIIIYFINIDNIILKRYTGIPYCIGFMMFFIFVFKIFDKFHIKTKLIDLAGKYSLELYITHVSFRRTFSYMGWGNYKTFNYVIIILLSVVCSYVIKYLSNKISSWKIFA